jgi:hypothetical protein
MNVSMGFSFSSGEEARWSNVRISSGVTGLSLYDTFHLKVPTDDIRVTDLNKRLLYSFFTSSLQCSSAVSTTSTIKLPPRSIAGSLM